MTLKIGIVGLPNVGKSTLFKALTKQSVDIANYPFATIDPNIGVVKVPDERLEKLARFSASKKVVPAVVEFVDIAGLVKGAAEGQGLGNKFLSHIKEVDAIAEVVRVFEDENIIHVAGKSNPTSDIEVLEYELILKDLETVEKRLETAKSDARGRKKNAEEEVKMLEKIKQNLENGLPAKNLINSLPDKPSHLYRGVLNLAERTEKATLTQRQDREIFKRWEDKEKELVEMLIKETQLLSAKSIIYVFNASEEQIQKKWQPDAELKSKIGNSPYTVLAAKVESDLSGMNEKESKEYLKTIDVEESGLDQLIKIGYRTLGLMTFFTTGEDETRAWTILSGSSAPRAGRAIHSDFEEKFIRAEVINWQKLLAAQTMGEPRLDGRDSGSRQKAKELGLLRTEGKNYIVQDGDVVEFKI